MLNKELERYQSDTTKVMYAIRSPGTDTIIASGVYICLARKTTDCPKMCLQGVRKRYSCWVITV